MREIRLAVFASLLACSGVYSGWSADVYEDFNDWTWTFVTSTVTNDDWVANNAYIRTRTFGFAGGAAWLSHEADSYVKTPLLTNGYGMISFETASKNGAVIEFEVQTSTNGLAPWATLASGTNTASALSWSSWSFTLDAYEDAHLRIYATAPNSDAALGIDNVHVTDPPAKVDLGTPYTDPGAPEVGQAVHVFCTIEPSALATITSTKLIYEVSGTYATNAMSATATQNLYRTASPIPAQSTSGITVNYEVYVTLTGTNAITPATVSSFYKVAAKPFDADHDPMKVIGDATTTMTMVSNHLWRGIVTIPSPTNDATFQFEGVHTNGTTNTWSDTTPDSSELIVHGTADLSPGSITVDSMPAGDYAFMFNETNYEYVINSVQFNNFDDWTGADSEGIHTQDGWVVNDGWISPDAERKRGTRSCYLSADGGAYVRSPERTDGIGQISFWMRHWETNASPATECHVQVSETGGTDPGEWETIATIPANSPDFNRFVIPRNNRYDRYVRIQNTTGTPKAKLAIDEFMVMDPGAGIIMSNLIHAPSSPIHTDPVSISVNLETNRGANVTAVTTYWRSGTNGEFSTQAMSRSGNTWTTTTPIPPGEGDGADGLGAGTVQYYVEATYTGYDSELASPTPIPRDGSDGPASYIVESARVVYSNVTHTPLAPEAGSSFTVEADIIPFAGASNRSPRIYYRVGESDHFAWLEMAKTGTNHYVTQGTVPTSSHPGTPTYYYIATTFDGPSPLSPTNYPAGGETDPISVVSRAPTPDSDYTNMVVEGDFNGALHLVSDRQWSGIITVGSVTTPSFHFKGTGSATNTWGDIDPIGDTMPVFGTAAIGETNITLTGTYSNDFVFHFNETSGVYRAHRCVHEDYDDFALIAVPSSTAASNAAGWSVAAATVFDTNGVFEGRSVGLGGAVTDSWSYARSPAIDGGIGNISFWYRNGDETGTLPAALRVDVRSGEGPWATLDTITNILSPDYLYHEVTYASGVDDVEVQILWENSANPDDAPLSIDDFTIEELGPYVLISNVTHSPATPSITNQVTIEADASIISRATNITLTTWYRVGTNGNFTSTSMTNTGGGHYESDPPIPRGEAGEMQYYVEATFTGPLGGDELQAYVPIDGPNGPASYTNTEALAAEVHFESEEGWAASFGGVGTYTNGDWVLNRGNISGPPPFFFFTGTGTARLTNDDDPNTNSYVRSPLLPLGAGVLRFKAANDGLATTDLAIQRSTDGLSGWETVAKITSDSVETWKTHLVELNIEDATYIRITKPERTGLSQWVALDDIEISYPLARVAISNVAYHPYYPADTDTVRISCDISSIGSFAPALDITARVYYKLSSIGIFSGPLEMTRDGNHYVISTNIPAYNALDTVDYYIESTFKGYNRIVSFSPTYSPSNAPTSTYQYSVRAHESSYDSLQIAIGENTTGMSHLTDDTWIGLLDITSPSSNVTVNLQGVDFYNGSNVIEGIASTWGAPDHSRDSLPYFVTMELGETDLLLTGALSGQYVLVFDETTRQLTVRAGVYQDFDIWPASSTYFESSTGGTRLDQITTDFENATDWPHSTTITVDEDFLTGWVATSNYPPLVAYSNLIVGIGDGGDFAIQKGLVIPHLGEDKAAMLHDLAAVDGAVRMNLNYTEGAGAVSFDVRCVNDTFEPALYTNSFTNCRVQASIQADAIPITTDATACGESYVSIFGRYQNASNYYELRMAQTALGTKRLQIWKNRNGDLTQLGSDGYLGGSKITEKENISMLIYNRNASTVVIRVYENSWQRQAVADTTNPIKTGGWVGFNTMDADIAVDDVAVFLATGENYGDSDDTVLYSEAFTTNPLTGWATNGTPWSLESEKLVRPGYTGDPLSLTIDYTLDAPPSLTWTPVATFSGFTNSAYTQVVHHVDLPDNLFLRIRHSAGTGNPVIDNIDIDSWHGETVSDTNGWKAAAAWVADNSATNGASGNESNVVELVASRAYDDEEQYLRSPLLTNGAAVIEFDYASITGTNDTLIFSIDFTVEGDTNTWITNTIVTNTASGWNHYALSFPPPTNPYSQYMRIANVSSDKDAGMAIDDVVITPPLVLDSTLWRGYNLLVTGAQADKLMNDPGNIKGAYINNDPTDGTADGVEYTNSNAYIETPYLEAGVGEVSFWHRAWSAASDSQIDILASANRFAPEDEWVLLGSVTNITNLDFQYCSLDFYEPDYNFVRLRVNAGEDFNRACIDNLLVATPYGASVKLRDPTGWSGNLSPEVPLNTDDVFVRVEVYDHFLNPSNISLKLYYQTGEGNWGEFNNPTEREMTQIASNATYQTYQNLVAIPSASVDTPVQYYVEASFDGYFSEQSSPLQHKEFTAPDHYWPIDLNDGQSNTTPYYIVFSCLPGQVWINELNVQDTSYGTTKQYVELCGVAGSDIDGWKLRVLDTDFSTNTTHTLSGDGTTLGNETNSYGFYVLGASGIPERDTLLSPALPDSGAARLVRSMGAIEHGVSWDTGFEGGGKDMADDASQRLVYVGYDDNWEDWVIATYDPGSNAVDFSWAADTDTYTPGAINPLQTLIPWSTTNTPQSAYEGALAIDDFWTDGSTITMIVSAETNGLTMTPWYSTNLSESTWNEAANAGQSISGTTYTVWCDLYTNAPGAFYKVTTE